MGLSGITPAGNLAPAFLLAAILAPMSLLVSIREAGLQRESPLGESSGEEEGSIPFFHFNS